MAENNRQQFLVVLPGGKLCQGEIYPAWLFKEAGVKQTMSKAWADYMFQEIMPYVESNFRTVPKRECRGTAGYSKGGNDSPLLAFMRPDLFSVVGVYAGATRFDFEEATKDYNAVKYPLRFWIWHGRNDINVPFATSEKFVGFLKEKGWEYIFEADDSNHFGIAGPLAKSLQYFSQVFGPAQVVVQPKGKLAVTWGAMKRR
jgi:hypothetical protein